MKSLETKDRSEKEIFVNSIKLVNYRNFDSKVFNFGNKLVAFIGNNGVGKTNILEAISLASPGKGLRNAKSEELENCNSQKYFNGFSVTMDFKADDIDYELQNSKTDNISNRSILLNKCKVSKQAELTKYLNVIWLIPSYDTIFIAQRSERRKFFDRIVFNLFPEHLQNLQRYEHYQRERLQVILNTGIDNKWLDSIEQKLAELNSSISSNRVQTIKYLNAELANLEESYPKALLFFDAECFEKLYLDGKTASEVEAKASALLRESRSQDLLKKQTTFGVHKSDFSCLYEEKNMNASFCSTGEQKSLLVSIYMAQAKLLTKYNNKTPILLLDEITSHLDKYNAAAFIKDLIKLKIQCFMTGTNEKFFQQFEELQIIELTQSSHQENRLSALNL